MPPEEEEEPLQAKLADGAIQRDEMPPEEEEEPLQAKLMVQRKSGEGGMAATPDLENSIESARGSGQSLSENIREPMEQAFGADFSGVKVHTDGQSDQLNQSIQARAFTTGQDIFFREGQYDPGSQGGQELLAHELTHVVQQNGMVQLQRQPKPVQEKPEIEATEEAMLRHIVEGMNTANGPVSANSGIHYASSYHRNVRHGLRGYVERWKEEFWHGYADPQYFERLGFWDWQLKKGKSASAAVKSWLKGLTIADCQTTIQTIHYDTIRAAIGDEKFDKEFGSETEEVPEEQKLRISPLEEKVPLYKFLTKTTAAKSGEKGEIGNRPNLQAGEWYYFSNYSKYLLKHPGGEWQGEHALYMGVDEKGEQRWSGFGVNNYTEKQILQEMVDAYNAPRTPSDIAEMKRLVDVYTEKFEGDRKKAGQFILLFFDGKREIELETEDGIRVLGDIFPETIKIEDILNDPGYTHPLDQGFRQGGLSIQQGKKLDVAKVGEIGN
jgi:hypothetical protein